MSREEQIQGVTQLRPQCALSSYLREYKCCPNQIGWYEKLPCICSLLSRPLPCTSLLLLLYLHVYSCLHALLPSQMLVALCAFSASLLPSLLLERLNIALYPLHCTLQRVDVLGKQLVADAVVVDHVVVRACTGGRGAEQEAEESLQCQISLSLDRSLYRARTPPWPGHHPSHLTNFTTPTTVWQQHHVE